MSTLTPLLDAQIARLRRRLGDSNNEDGTLITGDLLYASTSGTTFLQQELLDIYNDSIRSFMVYMTKAFSKKEWYEYLPGYIVTASNKTVTTGKMLMSVLSPTAFQTIEIKKYNSSTGVPTDLAIMISPDEWFSLQAGLVKTRKADTTHIFYTIMGDTAVSGVPSTLFVLPTTIAAIDAIYLKDHTDFVQNNATPGDLSGISQDALRRILLFAEVEARKWKSTEAADVPEMMLNNMMQQDGMGKE
jgi:hypothetical protein